MQGLDFFVVLGMELNALCTTTDQHSQLLDVIPMLHIQHRNIAKISPYLWMPFRFLNNVKTKLYFFVKQS
jgi:hypothetical protein